MSAWIKLEKNLDSDPRVLRMAKTLARGWIPHGCSCNAPALPAVTLVVGALARLWIFADSHIREDNTLDMGPADIDEWLGIPGFCDLLPADWLVKIDENTVELPGFQEHNGVEAKKRALTQKRVEAHREKQKREGVTPCNADALPDQDRDRDQDHKDISPPPAASDRELHKAIVEAYHEILPDLPGVRIWDDTRKKLVRARIAEQLKREKPADAIDYWQAYFRKVSASDFLTGRSGKWRADFNWLFEKSNFRKVIEGNYDNNRGAN